MNDLGRNVLNIMEGSLLGNMSIHVLTKQSNDAGINLNSLSSNDIPELAQRLKNVLPFFMGENSRDVLLNIKKLAKNNNYFMGVM